MDTETHTYIRSQGHRITHTRTATHTLTQADWWLEGRVGLARGDGSLLFQF